MRYLHTLLQRVQLNNFFVVFTHKILSREQFSKIMSRETANRRRVLSFNFTEISYARRGYKVKQALGTLRNLCIQYKVWTGSDNFLMRAFIRHYLYWILLKIEEIKMGFYEISTKIQDTPPTIRILNCSMCKSSIASNHEI